MVRPRRGNARRDHVAVADRLDLLETVLLGQRVEMAEQAVKYADDFGGRQSLRTWREVDDVSKQHRRGGEVIGNSVRARLQSLGDRGRQDVEQQALGPFLLPAESRKRVLPTLREQRQECEDHR